MGRWRTIEHTADLGLEVEASSPEELFAAAAHGVAGILTGAESGIPDPGDGAELWRELILKAPDMEALLVEWLRELLYIQTSEVRQIDSSGLVESVDPFLYREFLLWFSHGYFSLAVMSARSNFTEGPIVELKYIERTY